LKFCYLYIYLRTQERRNSYDIKVRTANGEWRTLPLEMMRMFWMILYIWMWFQ